MVVQESNDESGVICRWWDAQAFCISDIMAAFGLDGCSKSHVGATQP